MRPMRPRSRLDAYFSPAVSAAELVAIDDPSAAEHDRSWGAVTRIEALWRDEAVAGGFFDPAIFGPLDGSVRRWGHIDVAAGVVLAGTRVTKIPIPPIADRPPIVVDDPAARARWHGAINDAWLALLAASRLHDRLVALGVPAEMTRHHAAHVQQHFADVLAAMRGEVAAPHHHADHDIGDRYTMMPCPPVAPEVALAILFLDDDRILVQTTAGCRVIDRAGRVAMTWSPTGPTATSVHDDLVVFNGDQRPMWARGAYPDSLAWPEDATRNAPLAAYDLAARRWVMLVDDRFPAWVVDETDASGADAHELATGETHDLVAGAQRATQLAQTRDGRFALVRVARLSMYDDAADAGEDDAADEGDDHHGADGDDADEGESETDDEIDRALAIVEVATRRPFVCVTDSPADLPLIELGPATQTRPAVMSGAAGWRIVDPSGAIGDGARWWARLRGATVTAWSPAGQLGVIVGNELVLLEVAEDSVRVVARATIHGAAS